MTHLFARVLLVTLATLSTCVGAAAEPLVCETLKLGDTAASAADTGLHAAHPDLRFVRIVADEAALRGADRRSSPADAAGRHSGRFAIRAAA